MKPTPMVKSLLGVAVACAAVSWAGIGQASPLGSTAIFGDSVTINYEGTQTDTTAGAFLGAIFNGSTIPPFWCIDLIDHVPYPPWTLPDYTEAPFQSPPLNFSSTQVSNLETLFAQEYAYVSSFSSQTNVAAFQLAIWDLLFDTDYNLYTYPGMGGSTFGVVSIGDSAAETEAQNWINSAHTGIQQTYSLTQLTNSDDPRYQGFVFPTPFGESIPEPSDLALFGAGLAAMLFGLRRRLSVPFPFATSSRTCSGDTGSTPAWRYTYRT
ncbi:MAG TPA: PEP-CTERM sorting domain-containing protein [Casimicrobiaceae bacterium]|nr:PEP-CTERM sorting domain-containing protein [Casimicrobiaceae bacterium]